MKPTYEELEQHCIAAREKRMAMAKENAMLKQTLNKIGMLAMGELAYTSQFTEEVQQLVKKALGVKNN
jgi:hypothetical protein